ncbi:MAG TPA: helicase-exonuclease AddAB subunit AddB [Clostridiales bacterium]|nr:helicase-exonuclease AddAB subunit AddB [Clostridiales bacterium]
MSLRFIYGRAGIGKSYYCLNEIKSRIESGAANSLILLVPEQFSLQAERNLVKTMGSGGIIQTEVLSFRRMAYRVFNEVGGITFVRINSAGKCMIIHKILENMKGQLKIFTKSAEQQGFVNTMCEMIAEFKRYNITPDALEKACERLDTKSVENTKDIDGTKNIKNIDNIENTENIDDIEKIEANRTNSLLGQKLKELALIYKEYENIIGDKYKDADDDLTMLYEKLDETTMFDGAEIWIDEFSGFTSQEYKVIAKLMTKVSRINICLCTDCLVDEFAELCLSTGNALGSVTGPDGISGSGNGYGNSNGNIGINCVDVFYPAKNVVKKLTKIAEEYNITVESPVILKRQNHRFKNSQELEHLERYFYAFPYKKYQENTGKTTDISIFTASNIYTEIEHTARDIICLCRDEGLRYKDVTVVCGNLDTYDKFIRVIFTQYGIPYFIDKKRNITHHPLIQMIMSVFEIFIYNWSYEAVFGYLKTGLAGIPREEIDLIENYVLACGIRGNKWTREDDWEYIPDMIWEESEKQAYDDLLIKINDIRRRITAPLVEFHRHASGRKSTSDICEALFDLLCNLEVPDRIEMYLDKFENQGELALAGEYGQVWNITMEVLDQTVELLGDERIGLERFLNIIGIGFGEYKIGLIPPALDQVLVGNIERSKSHDVKALYILGVNDGVFPAPGDGEGILSDMDRGVLQSLGMELASDTRTKAFEDQYMIYSTLTTAEKYLKLSVPIADHEGKTLRPSIIISRLRKIFPSILEENNIVYSGMDNEDMKLISGRNPTFNELLSIIRKTVDGENMNPLWKDVYLWFANHDKWRHRCSTAMSALAYTNLVEPVSRQKAVQLYGNPAYSSVSRLEKYASCPFSYYIQYGLKVKERKIFQLTPPDIGTFLHAVLEEFSRYMAENGISWRNISKEECSGIVHKISDELLEKMQGGPIKNGTKRYRILVKRLDRVLLRAVWLIVEHVKRGGFEPVGYEINFGGRDGLPPINIELPSGEVIKLTGRIDRVDALETGDGTYIRIIDYKSGSKDFSLSNVFYGLQIQLITYLDALWREDGEENENSRRNDRMNKEFKLPMIPGGILYFKIDDPIIRNRKEFDEEEVEKAIMKQLKMKGLLLADVKVIKEMDRTIDGSSLIIPARINKGDILGKNSSAATIEQFNTLRKYVRKLLENMGTEIMRGDISISPYKNKNITSCQYCSYKSICQFDPVLKDNKYRIITDRNDDEVWSSMDMYCAENEKDCKI